MMKWKRESSQHVCQNSPQRLQTVTCHSDMQGSVVLFSGLYGLAKNCSDNPPNPQSICCIMMSKQTAYGGLSVCLSALKLGHVLRSRSPVVHDHSFLQVNQRVASKCALGWTDPYQSDSQLPFRRRKANFINPSRGWWFGALIKGTSAVPRTSTGTSPAASPHSVLGPSWT